MAHTAAQTRPVPPPLLAPSSALFLDFDGTLAPLASRPESVEVMPELPGLLATVHRHLDGAIAIITGRRLSDVDQHLAPFVFSGAGLHGAELRATAGGECRLQWNPDTRPLVESLRRRFATDPRILVEDKDASVALHYRQAPERAQECRDAMHQLIPPDEFEMMAGSMVIEARPRGAGKGRAVRLLLTHAPFAGRKPVFVGDDVTDEEGFAAVAELGGYGVKVGPGHSVARYRFESVHEVPAWLRTSLGRRR